MNVIGIDVSQGISHAALIDNEGLKTKFVFRHNKSGFKELAAYLNKSTLVIFETTGIYSAQLTRFLRQKKAHFIELSPYEAKLKAASLRRNKTDEADSLKLALLGIEQLKTLTPRYFMAPAYNKLHLLAARYEELLKERTRIVNHLHMALEQTFPELNTILKVTSKVGLCIIRMFAHPDFLVGMSYKTMCDLVYKSAGKHLKRSTVVFYCSQVWQAAKLSYPAVSADSILIDIIGEYCDQIEELNRRLNQAQNKLTRSAVSLNEYQYICSIPGIGQLNAALLLGYLGDLHRFQNYKQINAYVGLDINRYSSGKGGKKDKINRIGNKTARSIEFEAIACMLRTKNRRPNHLVDYYYKMKEPPYSKRDKVARIACINHLNRTLFYLVRTNQAYNYKKAVH